MSDFGFTIPANYLQDAVYSPGYPAHPEVQVLPDRGFRISTMTKPASMSFVAASQRTPAGINPIIKEFDVSFSNRTREEFSYIEAFFKVNKGVSSFSFVVPYTFSYSCQAGNVSGGDTSKLYIAYPPLYNVYEEATVSGAVLPNTKITQVDSELQFGISPTQVIEDGTALKITNTQRKLTVVCTEWSWVVNYLDAYTINAKFELVNLGRQTYTPQEGDTGLEI